MVGVVPQILHLSRSVRDGVGSTQSPTGTTGTTHVSVAENRTGPSTKHREASSPLAAAAATATASWLVRGRGWGLLPNCTAHTIHHLDNWWRDRELLL